MPFKIKRSTDIHHFQDHLKLKLFLQFIDISTLHTQLASFPHKISFLTNSLLHITLFTTESLCHTFTLTKCHIHPLSRALETKVLSWFIERMSLGLPGMALVLKHFFRRSRPHRASTSTHVPSSSIAEFPSRSNFSTKNTTGKIFLKQSHGPFNSFDIVRSIFSPLELFLVQAKKQEKKRGTLHFSLQTTKYAFRTCSRTISKSEQ